MGVWNCCVEFTVGIDYDDIEAETEEEAKQIAVERAMEDVDYNNSTDIDCRCICAWEEEENEDEQEH